MRRITRRKFLATTSAVGAAALVGRAPAFAQKRELSLLSNNHFVPAADD